MTGRAIGALFEIDKSAISIATRQVATILGTADGPLAPAPVQFRTLDSLHEHASRHGITSAARRRQPTPRQMTH